MIISVITPCYNRENSISRCIESVLKQINDEIEFIIIDDGSTDNSKELILNYCKGNHRIKFIDNKINRGVNYSRNRGIEMAIGAYILFLDSDDYLITDAFQIIYESINRHNNVVHYLFPVSYRINTRDSFIKEIFYHDWLFGKVRGDFTHLVKSSFLKKYNFFEDFTAHELLNWFRVIKATCPQLFINKNLIIVETKRKDSLSKKIAETNISCISEKYNANNFILNNYLIDDFRCKENPFYLEILKKSVIYGLLLKRFKENEIYLVELKGISKKDFLILTFLNKIKVSLIIKYVLTIRIKLK